MLRVVALASMAGGLDWGEGGGWVRTPPRREYDETCWLLKGRYNCAGDDRRPPADAWAHVGDRRTNATWRSLVAAAGGPFAVAARHRRDARRNGTTVVLLGNSFLRQVFEALACRWAADVAGGAVVARGPSMDLKALKRGTQNTVADQRLAAKGKDEDLALQREDRDGRTNKKVSRLRDLVQRGSDV